ncbi:hypothetical protein ALQ79_200380 [Pseudomonas amygdali pv. lachrymans]|nr:hypothetical protein ALQ79_200380 [Pseudomonas amygdali pv. lachrymans]
MSDTEIKATSCLAWSSPSAGVLPSLVFTVGLAIPMRRIVAHDSAWHPLGAVD